MKKFYAFLLAFGILFWSCEDDETDIISMPDPDPDPITYTSGSANFSNYVAVGNSLTAGYSDSALFIDGQTASYPNMLAENFALAGGGAFSIPFMADNLGGVTLGGVPILGNRLVFDFFTGAPTPVEGQGATEVTNTLSGPFNNMGVPGAKSYHLLAPGYGNVAGVQAGLANPYFARFASSPTATVIGDAVAQNPTFFTLAIGANDILGYTTSGGAGVDQTGNLDPSTYAGNDITDPNVFAASLDGVLQFLTAGGAQGAIANIHDVTSIPYFFVVPYAPLDPSNPDFGPQIPLLNTIFGSLNQIYMAIGQPERMVVFSDSEASPVVIVDENLADISATISGALLADLPTFEAFIAQFGLPPQAAPLVANLLGATYGQSRQATADDLLVLPSASVIGTVNTDAATNLVLQGLSPELAGQFSVEGVSLPLEDRWVLTPEEQQSARTALAAYNQTIAALAQQYDLAFVDCNAFLNDVAENGFPLSDGSVVTDEFVRGGGFSVDGVHPSPRGYALFANIFIEAINAKFGSNLPGVDPLDYTGLYIE